MIKVEHAEVWGFEHAVRGMRNPLNSWYNSDSEWNWVEDKSPINTNDPGMTFVVGENDLALMQKLYKAGPEHRKYLRQIFVSMDVTAPRFWWQQLDAYKVGITTDSCSTMHTIHKKEFTMDDFSCENILVKEKIDTIIRWLNDYRDIYVNWDDSSKYMDVRGNKVEKKDVWMQMILLLPQSYNQRRTITMNYEHLLRLRSEGIYPFKKTVLVCVSADTGKSSDLRTNLNRLSKELHKRLSIHDQSSQCSHTLITYEQNR